MRITGKRIKPRILAIALVFILLSLLFLFSRRQIGDYSDPAGPLFSDNYADEQAGFNGRLRVATWNLHHAEDVELVTNTLKEAGELSDADLLLFQEVGLESVENIARGLGYNYVFYPAVYSRSLQDEFGNAILSKWPLHNPEKIVLPNALPGWLESRNASRATINLGKGEILVYSVHLDTTWIIPKWVPSQGQYLEEQLGKQANFVILGGDFNTWTPGSIASLENGLGKAGLVRLTKGTGYTFEVSNLRLTLDHIFTGEVSEYQAGVYRQTNASDHFPLWTDLVMPVAP